MKNQVIAGIIDKIADLMEIKGADTFKIRAYRRAASEIDGLTENLIEISKRGELESIPGIGKAISQKIKDIIETGTTPVYEELKSELPVTLTEILTLPGIGPKTVKLFYEKLGITSIDELEEAAREHNLRGTVKLGAKAEGGIIRAIEAMRRQDKRQSLGILLPIAEEIIEKLTRSNGIIRVSEAGSLRRRKDTIGDMDFVAEVSDVKAAIDAFTHLPQVAEVIESGESMCSVLTHSGIRMDLRMTPSESYGAMLHHFTGSQQHNIKMRGMARDKGLSISEHGVFRIDTGEKVVVGATEEEIFAVNGLPWIPPELREDRGEIEAALEGRLPQLIDVCDIKGDLHVHSIASDGGDTISEIVSAAKAVGYQYAAICDHSQSLSIANGLSTDRLDQEISEIREINSRLEGFHILAGIEADIKADGTIDVDPQVLNKLDIVIGSIHHRYKNTSEELTARIIRAIKSGTIDILGHPTGRMINQRDSSDFDLEKVFDAARAHSVAMEINSSPDRLDLNDIYARMAKERGLMLSINTDAHSVSEFESVRFGVYVARRAWLEPGDVLNTMSIESLLSWLKLRRS
ncbi:MAG: DNA polymerase/3'-5' exonuclease PolX [Armatimonadota bacterium]